MSVYEFNIVTCTLSLLQLWIRWIFSLSGFGIAPSVVIVVGFSVVMM